MKFWEYLAERQKQKTVRKAIERESQGIKEIIQNNTHAHAMELLGQTKETMQKYLKLVLDKKAE